MKYFLTSIPLFFFILFANAQGFVTYSDSINHFSISIPNGWKYGLNKMYPSIKLVAYRAPANISDTTKENFNINIIESPGSSLDLEYKGYAESLKTASKYQLLEQGDIILNGKKFKWLIETHQNPVGNIAMHNYDFITYQNGKTYILTMVTFSNNFINKKEMFQSIAGSFLLK